MMAVQKSTYISAGGHVALLGFAMFGGLFSAEPLELPTVEVSVVSEAEFAALTRNEPAPEIETPIPQLAAPNDTPDEAVSTPAPLPDPEPAIVMPDPVIVPQPVPQPAPIPDPAPVEPPAEDVVVIPDAAPTNSLRPKPRPADRVASEAVAPPDPSIDIDNAAQAATRPDANAETPIDEQSETAPEEATTEIMTEAETPASAPAQSQRPKSRPQAAATATSDAVSAALSEALGEAGTDTATSGPPLTAGETNALRLAVQSCWVVDVGNPSANVSVVVGMSMDRRGKVISGSLRLVSSKGGEGRAIDTAFQSARRAILRCQKQGYDLPADKYEQWQDIEMTFNPKDMRVR